MFERIDHPAQGRSGGCAGAGGRAYLESGQKLDGKGLQLIPAGSRLVLETPGGGGHGDPRQRAPELVHQDVSLGYVCADAAKAP
jgi:N-methylhydantoinase B